MPYEKVGDDDPVCIADEVPFEIPDGWEWCRLSTIGQWGAGATPLKSNDEFYNNGTIPWVLTGDLNDGYINFVSHKITELALEKSSLDIKPKGTILIAMYGATIGKLGILNIEATTNQACCACITYSQIYNKFLFYYLMYYKKDFIKKGAGAAQPNISKEKIVSTLFPLPPLTEQQRIVKEIEKYLPLINEYDQLQTELDTLDKEFPEKLKKSILQQAIKGKLVEQDPNDEPASVLLDKIRKEKEKLIKEDRIKKGKNESIIYKRDNSYYEKLNGVEKCIDDEIPFEIPEGWEWCRLVNVSETNIGLTYKPSDKTENGILVLRSNNIQSGTMNYEECVYVSCKVSSRVMIDKNDILICVRNGSRSLVGKCAIVDKDGMAFGAFMAKIKSMCYLYIKTFIDSPVFRNQLDGVKTETINQITQDMLKKQLLPLPPYAEQSRIVNKVNEIFNSIEMLL